MYKIIFVSLIILPLFTSSCIVSKKQFDKQSAEKERLSTLLYSTKKELIDQKESYLKKVDSLITLNDASSMDLIDKNNMLRQEIYQLYKNTDEKSLICEQLTKEIKAKDSMNSALIEKLNWIRKKEALLSEQLEDANTEKKTINKMLLACSRTRKKTKINTVKNKNSALVDFSDKQYEVFKAPKINKIKMGLKDKNGKSYRNLGNLINEHKSDTVLFATNAGMYLKNNEPKGLYIENGIEINSIDKKTEGYGNFYMQPNGIFFIKKDSAFVSTTSEYLKNDLNKALFATQSGPMLLIDDTINSKFAKNSTHLNIRSGVGVTKKNEIVFIRSKVPVTFYELAKLFKEKYHCNNALYLDGVISRMYLPEINAADTGGDFGPIIYITQ